LLPACSIDWFASSRHRCSRFFFARRHELLAILLAWRPRRAPPEPLPAGLPRFRAHLSGFGGLARAKGGIGKRGTAVKGLPFQFSKQPADPLRDHSRRNGRIPRPGRRRGASTERPESSRGVVQRPVILARVSALQAAFSAYVFQFLRMSRPFGLGTAASADRPPQSIAGESRRFLWGLAAGDHGAHAFQQGNPGLNPVPG